MNKLGRVTNVLCRIKKIPFGTATLTTMESPSRMASIQDAPEDPIQLFSDLIAAYKTTNPDKPYVPMNIATIDEEFGVLNRTVVYRGVEDGDIIFVTEKNTRKFKNIIKDPRTSITFLLDKVEIDQINTVWQIRLFGTASEILPNQISKLWTQEPIFAKIRSRICECGKPINVEQLKEAHDKLLKAYESGKDSLPQTPTYTALKIIPTIWDFYKSEQNCIADRLQYRKEDGDWRKMHVAS